MSNNNNHNKMKRKWREWMNGWMSGEKRLKSSVKAKKTNW